MVYCYRDAYSAFRVVFLDGRVEIIQINFTLCLVMLSDRSTTSRSRRFPSRAAFSRSRSPNTAHRHHEAGRCRRGFPMPRWCCLSLVGDGDGDQRAGMVSAEGLECSWRLCGALREVTIV